MRLRFRILELPPRVKKTPRRRRTDLPRDDRADSKQANNAAYEEAVKLLQKIRELMGCLDRVTEFEDYLAALRVEYKRKRNFIKLLDTIESL